MHLRAQYGAKLSMIDDWLGRILEVVDRHDAWDTTAFILCTDHGHYLGERGVWGKPQVPVHPELGHIPLLVAWPGVAAGTNGALTTTVDLHATLCDAFAVTPEHRTHGRSLVPLLDGTATAIREWALCGVWGREVHVADATRTYAKAPVEGNRPLSMSSNRWTTMPIRALPGYRMPRPDQRAWLDRCAGHRRAGDPPAVRPERRPALLGRAAASPATCSTTAPRPTPPGRSGTRPARAATRRWPTSSWRRCAPSRHPTEQLVRLGLG